MSDISKIQSLLMGKKIVCVEDETHEGEGVLCITFDDGTFFDIHTDSEFGVYIWEKKSDDEPSVSVSFEPCKA